MIGGLQMLRGLAATLVVLFHLQVAVLAEEHSPGILGWFAGGEAGVDVFFVLSGFVIFHVAANRPDPGAARFLLRRFWRIVPPYLAALALTLLLLVIASAVHGDWTALPGARQIAVSVLLLPLPDQVMAVAWTLTVEGMFYLLFAATWFRFGLRGAIAALALWSALAQGLRLSGVELPPALGLVLHPVVIEFLFGGLIALALGDGWRRGAALSVIAGALGLAATVSGAVSLHWGREWVAGLPAAALVYGLAAGNWRMPGWTLLWGEASYLLYLLHLLVFSVADALLRLAGIAPYGSVLTMLAHPALALGVAVAATLWLERPYRRWTRDR